MEELTPNPDEASVTGTFAGVEPVGDIDGRVMVDGGRGPMLGRLRQRYLQLLESKCPAA